MRLIDADELRKKAYWMKMFDNQGISYDVKAVSVSNIDFAPTIEAVEIVKCKNCLWANTNLFAKELGIVYCNNYGKRKKQDDFCSEGERRGD